MKAYIPVVMVVGLSGCRSMFAADEYSGFRDEISRTISYPEFARKNYLEGIVNVDISTDKSGRVLVFESNATHPGLLEYVINQIKRIVLIGTEFSEKQFRLILKFIMY